MHALDAPSGQAIKALGLAGSCKAMYEVEKLTSCYEGTYSR